MEELQVEVKKLLEVTQSLLGPGGCPWDQKQTLKTLRDFMLEEYSEYLDALESNDAEGIQEELGDVFFQAAFLLLVGEKEGNFQAKEVVKGIKDKLVRRHPHVFSDAKIETEEELHKQWNAIKKSEKNKESKGPLDRIPNSLPAIQRGNELASIARKSQVDLPLPKEGDTEEAIGYEIFRQIFICSQNKISTEGALRKYMKNVEGVIKEKAGDYLKA